MALETGGRVVAAAAGRPRVAAQARAGGVAAASSLRCPGR
jgi:hypothetical protein